MKSESPISIPNELNLYRVGGIAALILVVFMPIQMVVFLLSPPPSTVYGWFALFQANPLIGLLDMDLLLTVDYVLMIVVFVSLWFSLRRSSEAFMTLALILQLVSIAAYLSSTTAFQMLSLSSKYGVATSETERSIYLAAGQVMLSNWQGTAFDVSYLLGSAATLLASAIMFKSRPLYTRATACLGIASGALMCIPPTVGSVGLVMSAISVPPAAVWLAMISKTLFRFSTSAPGQFI